MEFAQRTEWTAPVLGAVLFRSLLLVTQPRGEGAVNSTWPHPQTNIIFKPNLGKEVYNNSMQYGYNPLIMVKGLR